MKKKKVFLLFASIILAGNLGAAVVQAQDKPTYTVGICQFMQHQALDASTKGFKDALTEKFGEQVVFEEQNAQGDYATCTTVVNDLVAKDVDLILANATAALQAAATATSEIPILGTSVTEYGAALQLKDFDGTVGGNISGTSDLAPLDEQAAVVKELFPDAEKVGLLYCSGEPNSQYQIEVVQKELEALGYTCEPYTFADSNDISSVTMKAASQSDVIYIPTDNTAASNAELIANICIPDKVPVVAGDEHTCQLCGVASFSVDYYDLGYTTGEMAARILADGEDISSMPIEYASDFTRRYQAENCEKLGISVPESYVALDTE
ncbi:MAG: ABC transporter substrate-binding protein [Eubacteriales bacterium]|nr:ABC transporter substrate-binding protein [Eubacteriales bacterium]